MNSNTPPTIHSLKRPGLVFVVLAAFVALLLSSAANVSAQEVADTIKVNTRVVFMDALASM